jgi:nicotinate-nucleotide adenylyltransferase
VHVTEQALKRLALDEIWWLVSPQNPLKPEIGMDRFANRLAGARSVARKLAHVRVTDIETRLGTRYTVDTLAALHRRFPATRFVWLIGADNLRQIRHWRRWRRIFETTPIAVFARPYHSLDALAGLAARRYAARGIRPAKARFLADAAPPAWSFFPVRLDPTSATAIRAART